MWLALNTDQNIFVHSSIKEIIVEFSFVERFHVFIKTYDMALHDKTK